MTRHGDRPQIVAHDFYAAEHVNSRHMKPAPNPSFNVIELDVMALAKAGASLQGAWPVQNLDRWCDGMHAPGLVTDAIQWSAQGELRQVKGREPQCWLHVQASAPAVLTCQRCLDPVNESIRVDRLFLFVQGQTQAEALDAQSEEDVLPLTAALNLQTLIEDELLLALPLVPRHKTCQPPLGRETSSATPPSAEPHPFAILATLKATKNKRSTF